MPSFISLRTQPFVRVHFPYPYAYTPCNVLARRGPRKWQEALEMELGRIANRLRLGSAPVQPEPPATRPFTFYKSPNLHAGRGTHASPTEIKRAATTRMRLCSPPTARTVYLFQRSLLWLSLAVSSPTICRDSRGASALARSPTGPPISANAPTTPATCRVPRAANFAARYWVAHPWASLPGTWSAGAPFPSVAPPPHAIKAADAPPALTLFPCGRKFQPAES
ncbi:hypothetical protein GGR56DRAFT_32313 [Xylariaceae sp. FL0804]|nr:hypothetical protein GGR56DRAFT_32313 [Xylariaceae sp. FL0804]